MKLIKGPNRAFFNAKKPKIGYHLSMIVLISPAKKLDFETPITHSEQTSPEFLEKTNVLASELKKLGADEVGRLMKLSSKLSELNFSRFQSFKKAYNPDTSKQAAFAFNGDTYTGLDINSFTKAQLKDAQKKIRILSGLYGILKPLDLIQPYRLEMGTKFKFSNFKNLYDYWGEDVTKLLNQEVKKDSVIINCASNEYFGVINQKNLKSKIITPVFKEKKNGEYKVIGFNAKRARGMMAAFIVKNNIANPIDLKKFDLDGYKFNSKLSSAEQPTFTR